MIKYEDLRALTTELEDFLCTDMAQGLSYLGVIISERSGTPRWVLQVWELPEFSNATFVDEYRPQGTWDRVLTVQVLPRVLLREYQCNYYQHNPT